MKKKIAIIVATAFLGISLVGCGASEETSTIIDDNLVVSTVSDSNEENILADDYQQHLLDEEAGIDDGNNLLDEFLLSLLEEEEEKEKANTESVSSETEEDVEDTVEDNPVSSEAVISNPDDDFWGNMLVHYSGNDNVNTVVFVKCLSGSDAIVELHDKSASGHFEQIMTCPAYIGHNGYSMPGQRYEGDGTVPCGDFGVTHAMGIKSAPETSMNYLQFTDDLYWSDNPYVCYNQLVSIYDHPDVTGEHLAGIFPEYNYVLALDFNPECTPGVGSAIFFHCMGEKTYTGGCVAVPEENMLTVMKYFDANDRIIIFPENYQ